jgi:hypothetical protein
MARMGRAADRVFVGRGSDGQATLVLRDDQSRPRLTLSVFPDGAAKIQFLDEDGNPTREIAPQRQTRTLPLPSVREAAGLGGREPVEDAMGVGLGSRRAGWTWTPRLQ